MKKRELRITIENDEIREEFLNKLLKELKIDYVKVGVKGKSIVITLYGTKDIINYNWNIIKKLRKELTYIHTLKQPSKIKRYMHRFLQKLSKTTFPLEVLEVVLKCKKFYAKIINNEILETNASLDEVLELAKNIGRKLQELRLVTKSSSAKKFLASIMAILNLDIKEARDLSLKLNVVREDELGFIRLTREWKEAVKKVLQAFEGKEIKS
ncbi:MAG: hypothetical protein DRO23_12860 [Thermoprotei archaeon]|nr:MAG: hypothetical protein DRO23_12860 [Thermoprotei archaeon]